MHFNFFENLILHIFLIIIIIIRCSGMFRNVLGCSIFPVLLTAIEINQKIDQSRSKSIKVNNHKKLCDRFLSTSDICRLTSIEFDRQ